MRFIPLSMTLGGSSEENGIYSPTMMNSLSILQQNSDFVMGAYNMSALMGGMFLLVVLDTALKAWAMWRAARLEKKSWFIALLVINSMGILPLIFLAITRDEYRRSAEVEKV